MTFQNATFGRNINFSDASFANGANFCNTTFSDNANFTTAHFVNGCDFSESTFGANTIFNGAKFDDGDAVFFHATFGRDAQFLNCGFKKTARFLETTFGARANFANSLFHSKAYFIKAIFKTDGGSEDVANFSSAQFKATVSFKQSHFFHRVNFTGCEFNSAAYFDYTVFDEEASFQDAKFNGSAIFANANFVQPPDFEGCDGESRFDVVGITVSFSGIRPKYLWWAEQPNHEHWTINTAIPTRLRRFRKLMDDAKAQDIERDLFILERKAERGISINRTKPSPFSASPFGPIALLYFYELISDCGRSALKPFGFFIANLFLFFGLHLFLYSFLISPIPLLRYVWWLCSDLEKYSQQFFADIFTFTIGNALPLLGSLSSTRDAALKRLFINTGDTFINMPLWMQAAGLCESVIGAVLFFLFILAIRNHFRIR